MRTKDPTIDRIREVRHQISAEFAHDPKKVVAFYADLEKEFLGRFLGDEKPLPEVGTDRASPESWRRRAG